MKTGKIKDIKVPLDVVLGSTSVTLDYLAGMGIGQVVELDALAGEPVELRAAGELIAKGEVVVIDENFGLRVTEILNNESL